ncbi:unnamed protein product [Coccothraustes coccothraustes]
MAALALAVALGAVLVALGAVLVAAVARRGPDGPRLAVPGRAVAHRGGAGERIENTMEAFENAVRQGCDWLELDVRRTRDGVAVVCHDRDLSRQSGRHLDLGQLDYKDLPPYRSPLEVTFSPGSFSSGCDRRIPRLVEVFQRFPRQPISIEVKDDDDDLINEVASLVRRFDRAPITLWASFPPARPPQMPPSPPPAFRLSRPSLPPRQISRELPLKRTGISRDRAPPPQPVPSSAFQPSRHAKSREISHSDATLCREISFLPPTLTTSSFPPSRSAKCREISR